MRQKFTVRGEFLLPEDFSGGFREALALYVAHCQENWQSQPKMPSMLPESECFPFLVENGKDAYSTFAIETFRFDSLEDPFDIEAAQEENEILWPLE